MRKFSKYHPGLAAMTDLKALVDLACSQIADLSKKLLEKD